MTEKEWRAELDTALAGGRPWKVTSAWCHRGTPTCGAELAHTGTGAARTVTLSAAEFQTPVARKAEIVRQLAFERGH